MNSIVKERAAETLAAAVLVALLSAAVALGALVQERTEADRISEYLVGMAQRSLAGSDGSLVPTSISYRVSLPMRRAFQMRTRDGRKAGLGISVIVKGPYWSTELLVVTDNQGRIRSAASREGASGIHAEELDIYLRQREKGTSSGLGPSADFRILDYAVQAALEAAVDFARASQGDAP